MTALQVEQLVVRRGKQDVVHGIDLAVEPGEIVAVLGPNGAGKSTFLAAVGGLLPKRSGRVEHVGRVATVLQTPALAARSARANVELALAWSGSPHAGRRTRAMDALTRMRAEHLARRPARSLSGGEQRRVHLARAVAVAPDVMLLDEPFDGLDPQSHLDLRDDTVEVLRGCGSAVVAVLHERADAWAMADRLAVLIDGRLEALGSPGELLDRPPTVEVARFLGYDGELRRADGLLLTRPKHVQVDPLGKLPATVGRVVVTEDGSRVQLQTPEGVVWGAYPARDVRRGDEVHVTVTGGAHFPAG